MGESALHERKVLLGVGAGCLAGLAHPTPAAIAAPPPLPTDEVAPGIHFRRGMTKTPLSPTNGAIAKHRLHCRP